jgi:hypothetical protein
VISHDIDGGETEVVNLDGVKLVLKKGCNATSWIKNTFGSVPACLMVGSPWAGESRGFMSFKLIRSDNTYRLASEVSNLQTAGQAHTTGNNDVSPFLLVTVLQVGDFRFQHLT